MRFATLATYGGYVGEIYFGVTLTVVILFLISLTIFAVMYSGGDRAFGVGLVMSMLGCLLLALLCFGLSIF
jgi:hypothetical protein